MIGIYGIFLDIETHWTFACLYLISVAIFPVLFVYYCFCRKIYFWPLVWMRIPKPFWLVQVFFPGSKLFHGNWRPQESTGQSFILSIVPENSQEDYTCICKSQSHPVHVASVPSLVFFRGQEGETCVSGILCWWFSVCLKRTLLVIRPDAVDGRNPAPPGMNNLVYK